MILGIYSIFKITLYFNLRENGTVYLNIVLFMIKYTCHVHCIIYDKSTNIKYIVSFLMKLQM